MRTRLLAIGLSVVVGALLMAVKFLAYRLTDSSAILSDALESIINVVASLFAMGSIIVAAMPPDESHPYGHGKIEYFSAGFEGALIILAAIGIFKTGIPHLLYARQLPELEKGLLILLGASVVNLVLGLGLVRVGRRTDSLALLADGRHVLTDVYTSGGVILGLLLARQTGWFWLDGAVACVVGSHILFLGSKLVRQSFSGLMHRSDPELLQEIAGVLGARRKEIWIDIHELRAWRSGNFIHIDFHLILPRDLTLEEAHAEAKEAEGILTRHFEGRASALIHLDPCVYPDCPVCARRLCEYRSGEHKEFPDWTLQSMTKKVVDD